VLTLSHIKTDWEGDSSYKLLLGMTATKRKFKYA
jgi:hypothetical protein